MTMKHNLPVIMASTRCGSEPPSPTDMLGLGDPQPQPFYFDGKHDSAMLEAIQFYASGQTAYGQWFKKLSVED